MPNLTFLLLTNPFYEELKPLYPTPTIQSPRQLTKEEFSVAPILTRLPYHVGFISINEDKSIWWIEGIYRDIWS